MTSLRVGNSWVYAVAFSPDGRLLAAANGGGPIRIYDLSNNNLYHTYDVPFPIGVVWTAAISPDGKTVVAGSGTRYTAGEVTAWAVGGSTVPKLVSRTSAPVTALAFSSDNRLLVSSDESGLIRLYERSYWRLITTAQPHRDVVTSIALSPDGTALATGSYDESATILDLKQLTLGMRTRE